MTGVVVVTVGDISQVAERNRQPVERRSVAGVTASQHVAQCPLNTNTDLVHIGALL